jgi:hypothetical protein
MSTAAFNAATEPMSCGDANSVALTAKGSDCNSVTVIARTVGITAHPERIT